MQIGRRKKGVFGETIYPVLYNGNVITLPYYSYNVIKTEKGYTLDIISSGTTKFLNSIDKELQSQFPNTKPLFHCGSTILNINWHKEPTFTLLIRPYISHICYHRRYGCIFSIYDITEVVFKKYLFLRAIDLLPELLFEVFIKLVLIM